MHGTSCSWFEALEDRPIPPDPHVAWASPSAVLRSRPFMSRPAIFARGAARVSDVLERFWAGDDLDGLAEDFGVPRAELEDVVRVASRRAA